MSNNYTLRYPGSIRFGRGVLAELPAHLPPEGPVLIVTGRHAETDGLCEKLTGLVGEKRAVMVSGIRPELPLADVDLLLTAGRMSHVSAVVAVGGGSVIDAGKSAAVLMHEKAPVAEYFYGRVPMPEKRCFFAALPTTAGTGAEITPNAVLCDPESKLKKSIRHASMFADAALIDPDLTDSCPHEVTCASAFDSFTQSVESYISRRSNPASRALAAQAAGIVWRALHRLDRMTPEVRDDLAEGTMLGAMAFVSSGLGAVHGIGHGAGSLGHFAHGQACAVLLPGVLRHNLPDARLEELAKMLTGGRDAAFFIAEIESLRAAAGLPTDFKSAHFTREDLDFIVRNCRSGSMKSNPRDFDDPTVYAILEELS